VTGSFKNGVFSDLLGYLKCIRFTKRIHLQFRTLMISVDLRIICRSREFAERRFCINFPLSTTLVNNI
jgi:hypothetical protein